MASTFVAIEIVDFTCIISFFSQKFARGEIFLQLL